MALSYGIKLMPSLVYWQDGKQCIVENPDASFVRSLITEMPLIQTFDTQETNDLTINNETIS